MTLRIPRSASSRTQAAAFSLVEVVLALAIIATAFVAILGILPAGLDTARRAVDSTVVAAVLEDVNNRLKNQPLQPDTGNTVRAYYFDDLGVFLDPATATPADLNRRQYRADVKIGDWKSRPANTNGLLPVTIALSWPVDTAGNAIGKDNPKTVVTYAVTTLTGLNWASIYPSNLPAYKYEPKIEF